MSIDDACRRERIAHSVACAVQLAEWSTRSGTFLPVGHIERYHPAIIPLGPFVRKCVFGDVRLPNARRGSLAPDASRGAVADIVVGIGVGEIDVSWLLLDQDPRHAHALGGANSVVGPVMHYESLLIDFGGLYSRIQVDCPTPRETRWLEVMATSAMASLESVTQDFTISCRSEVPLRADDFPQILPVCGRQTHTEQVDVPNGERLFLEISAFLRARKAEGRDLVADAGATESLSIARAVTDEIRSGVRTSR